MRVQRAPNAAEQPQRPPAGIDVAPSAAAPGFSAHVDLDLTDLLRRLDDESQVVGEVIAQIVAACRRERLIDDESVLRVVKLTDAGLMGARFGVAVNQSAYGISSGLTSLSPTVPPTTPRTLTVILNGTRVQAVGDWGWGGLGVATLGRIVPTLVSAPDHGLSITHRSLANVGVTVPNTAANANGVVRALDSLARSLAS